MEYTNAEWCLHSIIKANEAPEISRYLYQREKQVEKVLANIEDDDIDLSMVIEQLWEDLQLAHEQILHTMDRSDFYADYYKLDKWDGKFNG